MADRPTEGAGFRIVGFVKRKFISPTGKFASLELDVPGERGEKKLDVRAFDAVVIGDIASLADGARVTVIGRIDSEPVKYKKADSGHVAGDPVMIEGYKRWVSVLTATKVTVDPSSREPLARPANDNKNPLDDDNVGW
jgi:hypothetical protein